MTRGTTKNLNTRLARLEAAAAGAGCALICAHQSAEEFHRALIGDYLRDHASRQTGLFVAALALLATLFILF
jgi:hypothetical protein